MAISLEQAAELVGVSVETFKSFSPQLRASYANRAEAGHAMPADPAKVSRLAAQRELAELTRQAAKLAAQPMPRFANGIAQRERTLAHLADRSIGIRRRLEKP